MNELEDFTIGCIDAITHNRLPEYLVSSNGEFDNLMCALSVYFLADNRDTPSDFKPRPKTIEQVSFINFLEGLDKKSEIERLYYHLERSGRQKVDLSNKTHREDAIALLGLKSILKEELGYTQETKDLKTA